MNPFQELDFVLKSAHLGMCAMAGEAMMRSVSGEDLVKSASLAEDPAAEGMSKSAAFYKSAAPDWLVNMFDDVQRNGGLGREMGNAVATGLPGGLLGYAAGQGLAKAVSRTPGRDDPQDEHDRYRRRTQLAGMALGIPAALLSARVGNKIDAIGEVDKFVGGFDRGSVGRFLDRITPR